MRGIGECQCWQRELGLGTHMQHLPACDESFERRAGCEQVCHLRCCSNQLLEVVQEQQHLLLLQGFRKAHGERLSHCVPDTKRPRDGRHDQHGIADGSERYKKHPLDEHVTQLCCDLYTQAGFACATSATGSGQEGLAGPRCGAAAAKRASLARAKAAKMASPCVSTS